MEMKKKIKNMNLSKDRKVILFTHAVAAAILSIELFNRECGIWPMVGAIIAINTLPWYFSGSYKAGKFFNSEGKEFDDTWLKYKFVLTIVSCLACFIALGWFFAEPVTGYIVANLCLAFLSIIEFIIDAPRGIIYNKHFIAKYRDKTPKDGFWEMKTDPKYRYMSTNIFNTDR